MKNFFPLVVISCFLYSCSSSQFVPGKKYTPQELRSDYVLLRGILETQHPSLYWYTGKDSMDAYFDLFYSVIKDSMTEQQFAWKVLAPLVDKIHCGHTSVGMSKAYSKWARDKRFPSFPLFMKVWKDTMVVTANLDRKDSLFKRGMVITGVNGRKAAALIDTLFYYLPEDGHANNINYIRLSANFPYYHRNIFGLSTKYDVSYLDSLGKERSATVKLFSPPKDSTRKDSLKRAMAPISPKIPREKRRTNLRNLTVDSSGMYAVMTLNTFTKGNLRGFFRQSFRKMKKAHIDNLVLDLRSNGGGRVGLSTLLTRYISRTPFRVADSVYATTRSLGKYSRYIKGGFLNNIELLFVTRKGVDGKYHSRHLEKKVIRPRHNRYNGKVYVLTNGPTFSASTIFCNAVKGQPGISLLGEETGGGWHGNNGIMIPDITLPHTRTRIRLPLFRVVQYNHIPKTGTGVLPDIYVGTSYEALLKGYDKKMQVVHDLILQPAEKKTE